LVGVLATRYRGQLLVVDLPPKDACLPRPAQLEPNDFLVGARRPSNLLDWAKAPVRPKHDRAHRADAFVAAETLILALAPRDRHGTVIVDRCMWIFAYGRGNQLFPVGIHRLRDVCRGPESLAPRLPPVETEPDPFEKDHKLSVMTVWGGQEPRVGKGPFARTCGDCQRPAPARSEGDRC
jgi:hypothetical protein